MANTYKKNRQAWLNAYRIVSIILMTAVAIMCGILLSRSFMPTTTKEMSKVEQASQYLKAIGFNDPVYEGVQRYLEGCFPKFEVTAIGGERLEVFIRTHPDGGIAVQPKGVWEEVSSADDFARKAQSAVSSWENIPSTIAPGSSEYQIRKESYDALARYNPPANYWGKVDETSGWPSR